jgi:hypothetical protein
VLTSASGALAGGDLVTFGADEMEFLRSHGIARLATSGEEDQPDVVPVGGQATWPRVTPLAWS